MLLLIAGHLYRLADFSSPDVVLSGEHCCFFGRDVVAPMASTQHRQDSCNLPGADVT